VTAGLALVLMLQAVVPGAAPDAGPHTLFVRTAGSSHVIAVPVISRPDGQLSVRADQLAGALGGTVRQQPNGHFIVGLPGAVLEFVDQSAFVMSATGDVIPLPSPATVDAQVLYLPLPVVADVLPRVASGLIYDPARTELRIFVALPSASQRQFMAAAHPPDGDRLFGGRSGSGGGTTVGLTDQAGSDRLAERDSVGVAPSGDVLMGDSRTDIALADPGAGSKRRRLVVVDAGHGGPDNGMSGPIGAATPLFYEKNIALAVALKVGAALRARGIDVIQTRTRDTLIALSDRGRIANDHHGDLFLSIHVNAANMAWHDPADARGFETYFLAAAKTEDARRVERMENEAVRFETGPNGAQHDPLDFVINDMVQNEYLRESSELAEMIQRQLGDVHPGPDRGVKQAGFRVLVTAYMPAVLVEIGFGTNADEARYLACPGGQARIASAIASATAAYLARYERRASSLSP
jgi:N-acetylmuramoyl-L-alanine amidase